MSNRRRRRVWLPVVRTTGSRQASVRKEKPASGENGRSGGRDGGRASPWKQRSQECNAHLEMRTIPAPRSGNARKLICRLWGILSSGHQLPGNLLHPPKKLPSRTSALTPNLSRHLTLITLALTVTLYTHTLILIT